MSQALASQTSVKLHAADMYAIFLGKKRLGFVRLYEPAGPAPIHWHPERVGGVSLNTTERIALVEKVRELMAAEWEKSEAQLKKLRDLENGVVTPQEPVNQDTPAEEQPAADQQ